MKKKLLKPPQNDGQILFLPKIKEFLKHLSEEDTVGTAHQPYFFHPGISVKFIFLQSLPRGKKKIIFLDTDRINLAVKIPSSGGLGEIVKLINTDSPLDDYPTPAGEVLDRFFNAVENKLKKNLPVDSSAILHTFSNFKALFLKNSSHKFLKDVLAESFLQFYNLGRNYSFLSDLIRANEYQEFFRKIYKDNTKFQEIFNCALDEYRQKFRFRYKNFPFPKMQVGELPFWIIKEGQRIRCFKQDINPAKSSKTKIFPRAVTLTIFLRLYKIDAFIHGIGGANYEWVQDRVIERFFKQTPPDYAVISGTFLINNLKERSFPYFLFSPEKISERISALFLLKKPI